MRPRGQGTRGPKVGTIDWQEFDKLVQYQCTQEEIASFFNISLDTLDLYVRDQYGIKLSEYWHKRKISGRTKLKKIQFKIAEEGNAAMAIFLGKHLLGQSDRAIDEVILDEAQKAGLTKDQVIELIRGYASQNISMPKKSFEEFCISAGYPRPYPKQIDMQHFAFDLNDPRLLLGSRGYGKTDYVTIMGVAYDCYLNQDTTNLIITKSKSRNTAIITEIKEALIKNGVALERENSNFIRTSGHQKKDHSVEVLTIKSSFRGRHPRRVLMDDPVTEEDTSEAMRSLVKKKYDEAYKLCKNIVIIGQPAHKFDLYAELRPKLERLEIPFGSIPELDPDLDAMRLAGVSEASIEMSYHLKIPKEGSTAFDNINFIDSFPLGDSVAFIDPSHEGGDCTAISALRAHFSGVAVEGYVFKKAWNHCLDDIAPILERLQVRRLAFETNALGDMPIKILRETFPGIGVIGRRSSTNKHARIMAAGAYAHHIHLSKRSGQAYIDQVLQYEYRAKNDDAPDSLALCLEWLNLIKGK
jgi:hypothetical protein